ncbi:DUF899 domain-containing protein [Amycolatopsis anabasis]|uniref:DUF899 domain-containing protein n=1 Tax=Amycolatopsis anabasis TaxID=1840409 RepID=UPI00131D2A87|nr:DUF899 domain-containing protein [Amycolatopsis anabasis]
MNLPPVVSADEWRVARNALLAKEKEFTHSRDALNAERRSLPMVKVVKEYQFEHPDGRVGLLDLFDGRRQLIVYHFMLAPGTDYRCSGCSMVVDHIGELAHLHARDTSLVVVSRAPLAEIMPFKERMGWTVPWVSSEGSDFNFDFGATTAAGEEPGLSVFLRDGTEIFHTYHTSGRGLELLGSTWSYLDLTPLGRQEDWEKPPGRGNSPASSWWRLHDEYDT